MAHFIKKQLRPRGVNRENNRQLFCCVFFPFLSTFCLLEQNPSFHHTHASLTLFLINLYFFLLYLLMFDEGRMPRSPIPPLTSFHRKVQLQSREDEPPNKKGDEKCPPTSRATLFFCVHLIFNVSFSSLFVFS